MSKLDRLSIAIHFRPSLVFESKSETSPVKQLSGVSLRVGSSLTQMLDKDEKVYQGQNTLAYLSGATEVLNKKII
jgi:hypothetical protein